MVAQASKDPALDHLDADFRLGSVFGLARAGRNDRRAVVLSQVVVSGVEVGLIAAGMLDPRLEVIRNDDFRRTAEKGEHTNVGADPIEQLLALLGLGVGVVAGAQDADEDLGLEDLGSMWVGDRDCLVGIIDKDLLTIFVEKTHRRLQALGPCLMQSTELAVAVTIRVGFAILDPQQPQGYTLFVQLGVNEGPVRTGDDTRTRRRRLGKKEKVDAMRRNGRSACSGTSGRHASESMVGMARIMHLNMDLALAAAKLEVELHLPMADSVILATARQCEAMLWTRGADFEDIQGVRYVAKTL